ncbi:hypothetical protein [Nostoc sp.]
MAQAICYSEFRGNNYPRWIAIALVKTLLFSLLKKLLPDRRPILDKLQL